MDDIFGVSGGYYLGTGPGTINSGPFEMDNNEYETPGSGLKKSPKEAQAKPVQDRDRNDRSQSKNNENNRHHRSNQNSMPLPDFGDRYSANRTKDRLRREQQKAQQKSNGKQGWNLPEQPSSQPQQPPRFNGGQNSDSGSLPPRFKKMILHPGPHQHSHENENEVSL